MYNIEVFHGPKKQLSQYMQFTTFEAFLAWEHHFDWERQWHNGEVIGTEQHEGWYAQKSCGAWTIYHQSWQES